MRNAITALALLVAAPCWADTDATSTTAANAAKKLEAQAAELRAMLVNGRENISRSPQYANLRDATRQSNEMAMAYLRRMPLFQRPDAVPKTDLEAPVPAPVR